ncbi:unnamed protein product, partial [Hapterophycus canaliculatus]
VFNLPSFTSILGEQFGEVISVSSTGEVEYLPGPNFPGEDSFRYTITDSNGQASAPATVRLVTRPTTTGPVVNELRTGTSIGGAAVIDLEDVFVSQAPLDLSSITITQGPVNGTASIVNGQIVYTPAPESMDAYTGPDQLTFTVEDQNGVSSAPVTVFFNTTNSRLNNPIDPCDVNRDGDVTPLDALLVINLLNSRASGAGG